ncbi:mitochondrial translation release factor in rescue [Phlebotomus papatasi]|uniref:mitochondrial translation release factor in rescue n=1 Tax=Phlebotomus papatasi TaxID=29031 RepID=UPI002483D60A|nr:mitochondrial translation release factor in rescue [Phlebotomus papatasi]
MQELCKVIRILPLRSFPRGSIDVRITLKALKSTIDRSRFPRLLEEDLDENFVRGSGPGGQAVNKTSNCCVLRHKPTGITVKCHIHRSVSQNRKEAREILARKLDNHLNGELSVENQQKQIEKLKTRETDRRRKKLQELKKQWKEREQD